MSQCHSFPNISKHACSKGNFRPLKVIKVEALSGVDWNLIWCKLNNLNYRNLDHDSRFYNILDDRLRQRENFWPSVWKAIPNGFIKLKEILWQFYKTQLSLSNFKKMCWHIYASDFATKLNWLWRCTIILAVVYFLASFLPNSAIAVICVWLPYRMLQSVFYIFKYALIQILLSLGILEWKQDQELNRYRISDVSLSHFNYPSLNLKRE